MTQKSWQNTILWQWKYTHQRAPLGSSEHLTHAKWESCVLLATADCTAPCSQPPAVEEAPNSLRGSAHFPHGWRRWHHSVPEANYMLSLNEELPTGVTSGKRDLNSPGAEESLVGWLINPFLQHTQRGHMFLMTLKWADHTRGSLRTTKVFKAFVLNIRRQQDA